ncbi:hypothetical protein EZS27_037751, partial [termite gut metagenome]
MKRERKSLILKLAYYFNQPAFYLPQAVKSSILEFSRFPDMMPKALYRIYFW